MHFKPAGETLGKKICMYFFSWFCTCWCPCVGSVMTDFRSCVICMGLALYELNHCGHIDAICHRTCHLVNIGSGNGLLPDGTKPLPEPMLTNHQWGLVAFTRGQFCRKCPNYLSSIWVLKIDNSRLQMHPPFASELTHWTVSFDHWLSPIFANTWWK